MQSTIKRLTFRGSSLQNLKDFPDSAIRRVGFELDKVQHGKSPSDSKPMPSIGKGVEEIRVHDAAGAFRAIYVARLAGVVYVLHCFQKKTQKTAKRDLDLATQRLKELMIEIGV